MNKVCCFLARLYQKADFEAYLDGFSENVQEVIARFKFREELERLTELRGMSESDAKARIAAQATREQRRAVATHLIVNDGDLDTLDAQVREVWAALQAAGQHPG